MVNKRMDKVVVSGAVTSALLAAATFRMAAGL